MISYILNLTREVNTHLQGDKPKQKLKVVDRDSSKGRLQKKTELSRVWAKRTPSKQSYHVEEGVDEDGDSDELTMYALKKKGNCSWVRTYSGSRRHCYVQDPPHGPPVRPCL